jgi:hypothetical protein
MKCKLLVLSPLFSTATLFDTLAGTFEFPLLLFSVYGIGFGRLANMLEELHNRKTTQNQDRFFVLSSLRKRTATARDLLNDLRRAHGIEISDQTVRNRLKEANLKPRIPVHAPPLTQHHKAARMRFALDHRGNFVTGRLYCLQTSPDFVELVATVEYFI